MKSSLLIFPTLVLALAGALTAIGQVSPPEKREALLERAARLEVQPVGSSSARFAGAVDPFYTIDPAGTFRTASGGTTGPAVPAVSAASGEPMTSDRAILRALAERIQPTGVMQFGTSTLLLFGERRVRVGDFLSVPLNGNEYKVEVISADSRTFTLRLNNERISKRIQ